MNDVIKLLRDSRLYALQKGASDCITKLECTEGGLITMTIFLQPLDKVLIFNIDDGDWYDMETMRNYVVDAIGKELT